MRYRLKRRIDMGESLLIFLGLAGLTSLFSAPRSIEDLGVIGEYGFAISLILGSMIAVAGRHMNDRITGSALEGYGELALAFACCLRIVGLSFNAPITETLVGSLFTAAIVIGLFSDAFQTLKQRRKIISVMGHAQLEDLNGD